MKRRSLAEERPDLLPSWSPNNEISPNDITCGSHLKVLWRCEKAHEWSATVKNRALIGSGCPYCGCRAVLKGFNDLATIHPELIPEWSEKNELNPTDVTSYSNRKVWWRCGKGHEWFALISSRSDGHGCPYCTGQLVLEGYNDLKTTNPEIAEEWSGRNRRLNPTEVTAKSRLNVWWHCKKCNKDYKAVIDSRVKGLICPHCVRAIAEKIREERRIDRAIEKEFEYFFPQLAVVYYAGKRNMGVLTDDESVAGIPVTAYIPDIQLVIDVCDLDNEIQLKEYIFNKNKIIYRRLSSTLTVYETVDQIRHFFYEKHIHFNSSENEDVKIIREKYAIWARNRRFFS